MMYDNDNESFDSNEDNTENVDELFDWQLPLCFFKNRHKNKMEGSTCLPQTGRMKEKVAKVFSCFLVSRVNRRQQMTSSGQRCLAS